METKKPWMSKTVWTAVVLAGAAFFPKVQSWIAVHPEMFAQILAAVFFGLRLATNGSINISDEAIVAAPEVVVAPAEEKK